MNLALDCEFNEYKGELISMAIVSEDGQEFYEVLPCNEPKDWVKKNVIPILMKEPIFLSSFTSKLYEFLNRFDSIHIIADWPEDISYFCNSLITGAGSRIDTPNLTMEVIRIDFPSDIPHNALYDARGIAKVLFN